jgi:hypothetical protein
MSQELDELQAVLAGLSTAEVAALLGDDDLAAQLSEPLPDPSAPLRRDVAAGALAAQGDQLRPLDRPNQQNLGRPLVVTPGVPGLALDVRGADNLSETMTVTLLLVSPAYPNANKAARVVPPDSTARVTWGQGGVLCTATVDMRDGMQLSLCGSTCRVQIDLFGPPGTEPLNVSAFVSYGQRPQSEGKRPVLTLTATIAAGGGVSLPVPDFAYDVEVFSNTIGATLDVNQNNPAGALVAIRKLATDNSVRMVLVRGAYFVDIANTGAAPVNVSAVFGIDL